MHSNSQSLSLLQKFARCFLRKLYILILTGFELRISAKVFILDSPFSKVASLHSFLKIMFVMHSRFFLLDFAIFFTFWLVSCQMSCKDPFCPFCANGKTCSKAVLAMALGFSSGDCNAQYAKPKAYNRWWWWYFSKVYSFDPITLIKNIQRVNEHLKDMSYAAYTHYHEQKWWNNVCFWKKPRKNVPIFNCEITLVSFTRNVRLLATKM